MARIFRILTSMQLALVLIFVFGVSVATATFIENDYGSTAARALVYDAHWFELVLLILALNLTGNIIIRKLYRKPKLTLFIFHAAFILILLGGAVTRYVGYTGLMHIREGGTESRFISDRTYVEGRVTMNGETRKFGSPVLFSELTPGSFSKKISLGGKNFKFHSVGYIPDAVPGLQSVDNGKAMIHLVTPGNAGREHFILGIDQTKMLGKYNVRFGRSADSADINFFLQNGNLCMKSPDAIEVINMTQQGENMLAPDSTSPVTLMTLYKMQDLLFVLKDFKPSAREYPVHSEEENQANRNAVIMNVSSGDQANTLVLWGQENAVGRSATAALGDATVSMSYGARIRSLPFSIRLNDFILEKYPGSSSPSWFESKVTLVDPRSDLSEDHRIFMNNIMSHNGYRFYQTSYDKDEKGTVLAVNRDLWGTIVTYAGYILLALGMILSIFNKYSRFRQLAGRTGKVALKTVLFPLLIFAAHSVSAQDTASMNATNPASAANSTIPPSHRVDPGHAAEFGRLLIQDHEGRIKPVNTFSSEVLRKVARKENLYGLNSDQVMLGMMSEPGFWQTVPMIRLSHPQIKKLLGKESGLASFLDFMQGDRMEYILLPYVQAAQRKKPAYRDKFDTEVIRVDERVNICYMVYTDQLFNIFPVKGEPMGKWYAPQDVASNVPPDDSLFTDKILTLYLSEVKQALKTGDWSNASEYLSYIEKYQHKYGAALIPSEWKSSLEVWYNKADIFHRLSMLYGLAGFLMLLLQLVNLLAPKVRAGKVIAVFGWLIGLLFLAHMSGLALRWYVAGHAPWSNGYEALTYISWVTVLSGLIFSRRSPFTLSVTAILASIILMVAHLSWMDPTITNLVPVLKSIWLIIHVAVITASYAFLGLGALLAALNLILMNFKTPGNKDHLSSQITKLSGILEMTLIIGLYMVTVGTFLGGVWANESWGRYWGWDPKETWALVTVLVYAFIAHMRLIPGLGGQFLFNLCALFGYSSVIMTYFGVNYYLSGLHSYAKGDPLPVPSFIWYAISIAVLVSLLAYINERRLNKGTTG